MALSESVSENSQNKVFRIVNVLNIAMQHPLATIAIKSYLLFPQNSTTQAVSGSDDCLADKNSNRGESKSLVTIKYYVSLLKLPFQSSRPKIAH